MNVSIGDIFGAVKLRNMFGQYAIEVLESNKFIEEVSQKGESRTKYRISKAIPTKAEFQQLQNEKFTTSVNTLVIDAFGEAEILGDEMQSWYDNLSEGLQQTDKANSVQEAADAMQGRTLPDLPDITEHIKTVYLPSKNVTSRGDRAAELAAQLHRAAEVIESWLDDQQFDEDGNGKITIDGKEYAFEKEELETLASECEDAAQEFEGVEFPGMYG